MIKIKSVKPKEIHKIYGDMINDAVYERFKDRVNFNIDPVNNFKNSGYEYFNIEAPDCERVKVWFIKDELEVSFYLPKVQI